MSKNCNENEVEDYLVDNLTHEDYAAFHSVGIVAGVTDGIVTILGLSKVAYVKL
jgi:hypothetical protein